VCVLLPVSDSGSRRRSLSLRAAIGWFRRANSLSRDPSHATWSGVFLIPIGALRLSTMTFAHGSSLADAELPCVWSANSSPTLRRSMHLARYRCDRLRLIESSACSRDSVPWSEPKHVLRGTESVLTRLQRRGRAGHKFDAYAACGIGVAMPSPGLCRMPDFCGR
jgi:hypothetical protein